ncbi:hypothetical protein EJB05_48600, partial [Eragrostis curvula]
MQQPPGGAGVDVAIQAAKLQYLQCLLQSAATTIASTAAPGPDEMAAFGSISSLHQGAVPPASAAGVQMSCTAFDDMAAPVSSEELASQGFSYGGAHDDMMVACHGDSSLPPLTDLSDAGNPGDGCSATASSSLGDGTSSPLPWPEFFPDDPFITDFL